MPKVQRRTYRATLKKRRRPVTQSSLNALSSTTLLGLVLCLAVAGFVVFSLFRTDNQGWQPIGGTYSVVGEPTINADMINKVLEHYDSPAKGKGEALYTYGKQYHIDPVFALAFFMHESTLGKNGIAATTHSLGNIRATSGYEDYKGYRKYQNWEAGFEDWYKLIAQQYVKEWRLHTVEQIIPVYAPSSDNNNEQQYIKSIYYVVDRWRQGYVDVTTN